MNRKQVKLSPGEMEIMSVLWQQGDLTLSEFHRAIGRPIGYTTIQTRLNRLAEKGLVTRTDERPCRYRAVVQAEAVSANHLQDLVHRVAGGNIIPLVAQLVGDRNLSREEIAELKKIVLDAERRTKVSP